jgi:hypothetical protein
MPVKHIANWAERVPLLAGLPGISEEQAKRVFEEGTGPQGELLRTSIT